MEKRERKFSYFVNIFLSNIGSNGTRGYYSPSVQTTKHLDITHQVTLGYYAPSSQNPTDWRYYSRHGVSKLCLEKREEDPSEAPSFRCSMLFCFREHGWSIRLQYSREFVHFTHNPRSSPFTDKTMARFSLSSPSTFRIQPCQEPPNVGTQVRFPTKY